MTETTQPADAGRLDRGVMALAALLACLLVAGCGEAGEPWWVRDARKRCKPHGLALDRDSGGYIATNDVLLCPDGTLRIVPQLGAVDGKTHR